MARLARAELFDPSEVAVLHLCARVVRRCFLFGVRSRPDVVETWDDSEVARRWLMLCPKRKKPDKSPEEPNEFELNSIRNEPNKLATIRKRLSDVA